MAPIVDDPCYHGKKCACFTLQPWQFPQQERKCDHCYCTWDDSVSTSVPPKPKHRICCKCLDRRAVAS